METPLLAATHSSKSTVLTQTQGRMWNLHPKDFSFFQLYSDKMLATTKPQDIVVPKGETHT